MGTSPRMRGKLYQLVFMVRLRRNIPAYAGKTQASTLTTQLIAEHPRVCGENNAGVNLSTADCGTSPRMRGKRESRERHHGHRRNIPAYAGKTPQGPIPVSNATEHPRVCGENSHHRTDSAPRRGTSPRMRGKPPSSSTSFSRIRNIPAYAGKTCNNRRSATA